MIPSPANGIIDLSVVISASLISSPPPLCLGKAGRAATRRRDAHGNQRKSDLDLKVRFSGRCGGDNDR